MKIKKIYYYGLGSLLAIPVLLISVVIFCNWRINEVTSNHIFNDISQLPENEVGLVLGTSQYLKKGGRNPYFYNRIDAAEELYRSGKIKYIIVSGDNSSIYYNEPIAMKNELVKRGIPAEVIYLDYAGFRTLDSVVRSREIFGQSKITIISQKFHNQRAIFLAHHKGIEAIGFNAIDIEGSSGYKTRSRELVARVKAFSDLYLNTQPRFLGEKILIE